MARFVRKLTDTECRKARPMERDYKLYEEGNLRLLVRKSGTKVWQYPYKLHGKENVYTIGQYPHVSIADARQKRNEIKALVEQGLNPNREKAIRYAENALSSTNSFETIAREWHSKQIWNEKHTKTILRRLEANVFPFIGALPIRHVTAKDMLDVLQRVEEREALDMARRANQHCAAIFDYAIVKGICENNPATGRSKVIKSRQKKHRAHLSAKHLVDFLKALDGYHGGLKIKLAMQLLWLTFVRPGELRNAKWSDIDEDNAMWRIPAAQMKMKRPHLVPLSHHALVVLKELRPVSGKSPLLFPSAKNPNTPISDMTLTKVIKILKFHQEDAPDPKNPEEGRYFVPHGVRGTASTILNEIGKFKPDVIERQLAHIEGNSVRAAYNHAEYLDERTMMMQWWADYLDKAKTAKPANPKEI